MTSATKRGNIPDDSEQEIVDLSAGFVPKNPPAAGEPATTGLTPDAFMAQYRNDVDLSAAEPEKFDFVPEDVSTDGSEPKPIDGKPEITWRWAAESDLPALQRLHFEAEIAAGREMYLPNLSFPGGIAVAERNGQIIGGMFGEDSVVLTPIGMDSEVLESAGEVIIPKFIAQARKEGTRFLHCSLPARLAATLEGSLQKVGFKLADGIQYRLDTGIEAEERDSTRRN